MEHVQGARVSLRIKPTSIQTVFSLDIMQQLLPPEVVREFEAAQQGHQRLSLNSLAKIAEALKIWAIESGATFYSHWFIPLRDTVGIKEEAFTERLAPNTLVNLFSAYDLLMTEVDASSFPSGSLRNTANSRGYLLWDIYNPPFLDKQGDRATLNIPALFYSIDGKALDCKIPLLRAEDRLNRAATHLLQLLDVRSRNVIPTLGTEQEFFVIDQQILSKRLDLQTCGRTLFGARATQGQEFSSFYCAPINERIQKFLEDANRLALQAGIIIKTKHAEVAPNQFELTTQFARSIQASTQNSWLMVMLQSVARKHGLAVLLHEKPFQGLNGSGKHCNWSLATDMGLNLLDPSNDDGKGTFAMTLVAVLQATSQYNGLLRASIGSYANDFRLGGHEAPPTIVAVHLGNSLTEYLRNFELYGTKIFLHRTALTNNQLPFKDVLIDLTDRNRTSPIAFTSSKFELRMVGSNTNTAHVLAVFNTAVAHAMEDLTEQLQELLAVKPREEAISELVRTSFRRYAHVIYNGNNYSASWQQEAQDRNLKNYLTSYEAFQEYSNPVAVDLLKGVLTPEEIATRKEIFIEQYEQTVLLEARTAINIFYQQIAPACTTYIHYLYQTRNDLQNAGALSSLEFYSEVIDRLDRHLATAFSHIKKIESIKQILEGIVAWPLVLRSELEMLRNAIDAIEKIMPQQRWPLPTYDQMLHQS